MNPSCKTLHGTWGGGSGKRIRTEKNIKWHAKESYTYLQGLANNLGVSTRTIHYALQAYNKYPEIQSIPEGKNICLSKRLGRGWNLE